MPIHVGNLTSSHWKTYRCNHQRLGVTSERCTGVVFILGLGAGMVLVAEITERERSDLHAQRRTNEDALHMLGLSAWTRDHVA